MRTRRWRCWTMLCMIAVLTMALTVPAYAASKEKLDTPSSITLDEDGASWDEVSVDSNKTVKYEVQLYKGSEKIDTKSTSESWVSFANTIANNGTGNYRARVRAICSGYTNSSWSEKSDTFYVDTELLAQYKAENRTSGSSSSSSSSSSNSGNSSSWYTSSSSSSSSRSSSSSSPKNAVSKKSLKPGWNQDLVGWWYIDDQGNFAAHEWREIQGKWYYFSGNGYMITGWLNDGGNLYYLDETGARVTGSVEIGGVTYEFDENGVKQ